MTCVLLGSSPCLKKMFQRGVSVTSPHISLRRTICMSNMMLFNDRAVLAYLVARGMSDGEIATRSSTGFRAMIAYELGSCDVFRHRRVSLLRYGPSVGSRRPGDVGTTLPLPMLRDYLLDAPAATRCACAPADPNQTVCLQAAFHAAPTGRCAHPSHTQNQVH